MNRYQVQTFAASLLVAYWLFVALRFSQVDAFHITQSCGPSPNDRWLTTIGAGTGRTTIYDDTCEGGSCACRCSPGTIGQSQAALIPDNSRPGFYKYIDNWPYHCSANIRRDICSEHGYATTQTPFFDFQFASVQCLCDTNYVGKRIDGDGDSVQCMFRIIEDVCSGHGTFNTATQLRGDQQSSITCTCDSRYETVPTGVSNPNGFQCGRLKPCPVIGGVICGTHGSCGASQPVCTCSTGFGGTYCCPRSPSTLTGAICGGRGTCQNTGNCLCNVGFGGTYCCPQLSTQAAACGTHGTCTAAGTCSCATGWAGAACSVNVQCPTNDLSTPLECSAGGNCTTQSGPEHLINALRFVDDPAVTLTIQGTPFTDEGGITLTRSFLVHFLNYTSGQADSFILANQNFATMCAQDINKPRDSVCWAAYLEEFAELLAALPAPFVGQPVLYTVTVLQRQFPSFSSFDSAFVESAAADIAQPGMGATAIGKRKVAIASIMAYLFLRHPTVGIVTYPTFPRTVCVCSDAPLNAIIGVTRTGTGSDCSRICFVGNDRQACSGFKQGIFRGVCDTFSGQCSCGTKFEGPACQTSLSGRCFPVASTNENLCTHPSRGICESYVNPDTTLPDRRCACYPEWTGQFCEFSLCTPPNLGSTQRQIECSNRGQCAASGICTCDVAGSLALSDTVGSPPVLPVGDYCQSNAISQCGNSVNIGGGKVRWEECNNRGFCNATLKCECEEGAFGNRCQFSQCSPSCNATTTNKHCDHVSGLCVCNTRWSTPLGCSTEACLCSVHNCGFGEPVTIPASVNGPSSVVCECDANYVRDNTGKCTILRCPLVVLTNQGERPCNPNGQLCPSIVNTAQTRTNSLNTGCCYDACGSGCRRNTTNNSVYCLCSPAAAYREQSGICYSKCHGQPFSIVSQVAVCSCNGLLPLPVDQFMDNTCKIETCDNDGVPDGAGACTCPAAYVPPFCDRNACGDRGTPNVDGTECTCTLPFAHATINDKRCNGATCGTGQIALVNVSSPNPYRCVCPDNTLIGPNRFSCPELDCEDPDQETECDKCLHGSTPFIANNTILCDCTHVNYHGRYCNILDCLGGGTAAAGDTHCKCPYPFTGTRCETFNCGVGFPLTLTPSPGVNTTCVCKPGFSSSSRDRPCDTFTIGSSSTGSDYLVPYRPVNASDLNITDSSSSSGASSSSSTGSSSSSSTGVAATTAATASTGLSTGAIAGIAVAGGVVVAAALYIVVTKTATTVALQGPVTYTRVAPPVSGKVRQMKRQSRHQREANDPMHG